MRAECRVCLAAALFVLASAAGPSQSAKDQGGQTAEKGQVYVNVLPEEAYIWVDGKPMAHRSSFLNLPPGEHTITVYNYGYAPATKKVIAVSGKYLAINMYLKPKGDRVSGPWGRIQIEGVPDETLVFLNGTTPEFFVGHAGEMDNNFLTKQQLIVPAGKQQLYIVRRKTDQPIWSGPVDVQPNKRLIVYVKGQGKANMVYKNWADGAKTKPLKRFDASTATATIAVAPVTAKIAADKPAIQCDQPAKLSWSSADAAQTTVTANGQKLADSSSGDLDVQPKQATKYELRAAGPGGVVNQAATIDVDNTVKTSLEPSAPEVRYSKVGDTVQEQGSTTLNWTATNANSVEIDKIGPVSGNSGSENVQPSPTQTGIGPVDETVTYRITAKNDCGGSASSTASIHLTGSIEGETVAEAQPPPMPTPQSRLPQTASPLPLLALLGLALLAGGLARMIRIAR